MRKANQSYIKRHPVLTGLAILAAAVLAGVIYLFIYDPPYSGAVTVPERPLSIAHRGYGVLAPDNSLTAASAAMAAGQDGVDVDGQLTKDGQIVIYHDLSLDRLTSGSGKVGAHTLDELKRLDLGAEFGDPKYAGSYVASFEDFVTSIAPQGILMVELKVTGTGPTGIEQQAIDIIKKHNAQDRVYLSSFNPVVLWRLKQIDPNIKTVYIFMDTNWNPELLAEISPSDRVDLPWIVRQEWIRRAIRKIIKPDLLSVNVAVAEPTRQHLLKNGWPIFLWTPDAPEAIKQAAAQHPYGVISNEPERTKAIIRELYP